MVRTVAGKVLCGIAVILSASGGGSTTSPGTADKTAGLVALPTPTRSSNVSVEQALSKRRSTRQFLNAAITKDEMSTLLWAAQGITDRRGFRTAPSAGALYPLEVYVVAGQVDGLEPGVYRYHPQGHRLSKCASGDKRGALCDAALRQVPVRQVAAVIVIAGVYERTMRKYGKRGVQYVHIEVGASAQNVYLQAMALKLGTVLIGAFDERGVRSVLGLADNEIPLAILPIGRPKTQVDEGGGMKD